MARLLGDGSATPLLYRYRIVDQQANGFALDAFNIRGNSGFSVIQGPYKGIRIEIDQLTGNFTSSGFNIRVVLKNESNNQLQSLGALGGYWITGGDASFNGGSGVQRIYDNTSAAGHIISWNTGGPISGWVEMLFNYTGDSMSMAAVSSTSYYFDSDCQNSMTGASRISGPSGFNAVNSIIINSNTTIIGSEGTGNIRILGIRA